jgi:hypothetical protein
LVPPRELFYGQVVKVREATGHLLHVVSQVVSGGPRRFCREMERRGLGATIHTAFMERWYGTLRGLYAPLRRRTRGGSSSQSRHHARVWLLVDLYNFVLPPKLDFIHFGQLATGTVSYKTPATLGGLRCLRCPRNLPSC